MAVKTRTTSNKPQSNKATTHQESRERSIKQQSNEATRAAKTHSHLFRTTIPAEDPTHVMRATPSGADTAVPVTAVTHTTATATAPSLLSRSAMPWMRRCWKAGCISPEGRVEKVRVALGVP
jgi:hypothetical protein